MFFFQWVTDSGNQADRDTRTNTQDAIQASVEDILGLKTTESPSISLFAAVNLLFPGQKVISNATFYSPGEVEMYFSKP